MKKYIKATICALVILGGMLGVCSDFLGVHTGYQYAFNAGFIFLVLPVAVAESGILEWGRPDLFK